MKFKHGDVVKNDNGSMYLLLLNYSKSKLVAMHVYNAYDTCIVIESKDYEWENRNDQWRVIGNIEQVINNMGKKIAELTKEK